jgi:hypothetical protein
MTTGRAAEGSEAGPGPSTAGPVPRIARLTWQAGDPAAVVAALARRLGFEAAAEGFEAATAGIVGGVRLVLGEDTLDVVPWRHEGAGDDPVGEGRLVFEPILDDGPQAPGAPARRSIAAPGLPALVAVAWATVELDRAADELDPWLLPADGRGDAPEPLLGARARLRATSALPGSAILIVEPSTEGRLAASLARDGEGPCALYLRPSGGLDAWVAEARRRGVTVSGRRIGPLGPSVLVPGIAIAGPHLVLVERRDPASRRRGTGTIAP